MSLTSTAVRERPMLFSGEMVRAILDGRKTQTRRVIRRQPAGEWAAPGKTACPYGSPGDRLWVRETWGVVSLHELGQHIFRGPRRPDRDRVVYRAGIQVRSSEDAPPDYKLDRWPVRWSDDHFTPPRWRPSIHMPRWASRLTLEITGVRVERLQDISEDDALDEGMDYEWHGIPVGMGENFRKRWDALNAKRGYGWDVNPWVWVIEFRRVAQ